MAAPTAPPLRPMKPPQLDRELTETTSPLAYIHAFSLSHSLRSPSLEPALRLTDLFDVPRVDVHRKLMLQFKEQLLGRVSSMEDDVKSKLLLESVQFLQDRDLQEVFFALLKSTGVNVPEELYDRLAGLPTQSLMADHFPELCRTKVWEKHVDKFDGYAGELINKYRHDPRVARNTDNMEFLIRIEKLREPGFFPALTELVKAIGPSLVLFQRVANLVRIKYAETEDRSLCTLQSDLIMAWEYASRDELKDVTKPRVYANLVDKVHLRAVAVAADAVRLNHVIVRQRLAKKTDDASTITEAKAAVDKMASLVVDLATGVLVFRSKQIVEAEQVAKAEAQIKAREEVQAKAKEAALKAAEMGTTVVPTQPVLKKIKIKIGTPPFKKITAELFQKLAKYREFSNFNAPVVEKFPNLKYNYVDVIAHPMDFLTIKEKSESYKSFAQLRADVQLILDNCLQYNLVPGNKLRVDCQKMHGKAMQILDEEEAKFGDLMTPSDSSGDGGNNGAGVRGGELTTPSPGLSAELIVKTITGQVPIVISTTLADASMILSDAYVHHALAKLLLEVAQSMCFAEKKTPREVSIISTCVWLLHFGGNSLDIVRACQTGTSEMLVAGNPFALPNDSVLDDVTTRSVPLLMMAFFEFEKPYSANPVLLDRAKTCGVTRVLLLAMLLNRIRAGDEKFSLGLVHDVVENELYINQYGFLRGLGTAFEKVDGLPNVRKFVLEHIFLKMILDAKEKQARTAKLAEAHELFAWILGCPSTLKLAGGNDLGTEWILDCAKKALENIDSQLFTSSAFRIARKWYDAFFSKPAFASSRETFGLTGPHVPSNQASPGTNSPGDLSRPMSGGGASPPGAKPPSASPSMMLDL